MKKAIEMYVDPSPIDTDIETPINVEDEPLYVFDWNTGKQVPVTSLSFAIDADACTLSMSTNTVVATIKHTP